MKLRSIAVFFLVFFVSVATTSVPVLAGCGACTQQGDCNTCCSGPNCTYACTNKDVYGNGSCYWTNDVADNGCTSWGGWNTCSGGWQERFCQSPSNLSNLMQVQSCTTNPTPRPSSGPGCVIAAPAVTTLNAPANNPPYTGRTSSTDVTLQWTSPNWGTGCPPNDIFIVYVDTVNPPVTQVTTMTGTVTGTLNSFTFSGSPNTRYYWRVLASNGDLFAYSSTWSFVTPGTISGTIYNDDDGTCTSPTVINGTTYPSMNVSWGSSLQSSIGADGTYSIVTGSDVGPHNLILNNLPTDYVCSPACAGNSDGCYTKTSVLTNSPNRNFYLTQSRGAWWQVAGAGIYAGAESGLSVRSLLPTSVTRLITSSGSNGPGAMLKLSPTDADLGFGDQVMDNPEWKARSKYQGTKTDYTFFAGKIGVPSNSTNSWVSDSLGPVNPYDTSKDYYYIKPSSGTATVAAPWTLAANEHYIVFVNGNLDIAANITVPTNAFLSFIVKGNITVEPTVTAIAGLFVADQQFVANSVVSGDDVALTVQGSVVAWDRVSLSRDLGPGANFTTPAEKFVYRPDLLANMPLIMKTFVLNWQEVAPGTFGN